MSELRCFIGLHDWEYNRNESVMDGFPPAYGKYTQRKRRCLCCGKKQYWLPGYGGSEWGCWSPGYDGDFEAIERGK